LLLSVLQHCYTDNSLFFTDLSKSYARTVPSRLADSTTRPDAGPNTTLVTGAVWSLKVTKQKPDVADQSLTCVKKKASVHALDGRSHMLI